MVDDYAGCMALSAYGSTESVCSAHIRHKFFDRHPPAAILSRFATANLHGLIRRVGWLMSWLTTECAALSEQLAD